jgi:hypothetical protein
MTPDMFRKLEALGLTVAQIAGVVEIFNESAEPRRASGRDRQQRWREKNKAKLNVDVTKRYVTSTSDSELQTNVSQRLQTLADTFDVFWSLYPNKTGKLAGRKAWDKAVKRAEADVIMAGLHRYVNKRDDRHWCNPATWLNQGRWEDQTVRGGKKDNGDLLGEWIDENFSNQGNENGQENSGRHHGNVERLSAEQREGFKGRTIDLPPATRSGRH